jgi:hypothetical protein
MDNSMWQGKATQLSWENPACETDIRNFRRCMDDNKGDMSICGWYMDQLVRFGNSLQSASDRIFVSNDGLDC